MPLENATDTRRIIGAAIAVQTILGIGLAGHLYRRALAVELRARGEDVREEHQVEVTYRGVQVGKQQLDLVVRAKAATVGEPFIVIEVTHLPPTDVPRLALKKAQLSTYLAVVHARVGLVLNFGARPLVPLSVLNPNLKGKTP